jgi:hypothetical protein
MFQLREYHTFRCSPGTVRSGGRHPPRRSRWRNLATLPGTYRFRHWVIMGGVRSRHAEVFGIHLGWVRIAPSNLALFYTIRQYSRAGSAALKSLRSNRRIGTSCRSAWPSTSSRSRSRRRRNGLPAGERPGTRGPPPDAAKPRSEQVIHLHRDLCRDDELMVKLRDPVRLSAEGSGHSDSPRRARGPGVR